MSTAQPLNDDDLAGLERGFHIGSKPGGAGYFTVGDLVDEIDSWRVRAEAAEAERDQAVAEVRRLTHVGHDLAEEKLALNNRIAAALKEHTPFGPVGMACPTCRSGVKYDGLGRCPTRAALVEPVGEPPRPTPEETAAMDALVAESERLGMYRENYLTWDALRADVERLNARRVGEPQPPTCAECQDERWVCDRFGHGLCRDPRCVVNRRPCPSCAPTESDPT